MFWFHGCITAISTDNLYTLDVYIYLSNLYKELQANLGFRILSLPYLKIYPQTFTNTTELTIF